jgi:ABC-type antimicrobial peptide transport system ATPase subunit
MPTHKSSLPLLTVLLFLSATIAIVSSQTLPSPDELLKEAYNKTIKAASLIAAIPSLLDGKEPTNPLKPCTNCGSCLLSLSRFINTIPDTSSLSIEQIKHQV